MDTTADTISQLRAQWVHPTQICAILMIVGGDLIRTALAQSAGNWYTPVCFSFGWVSYSITAFISLLMNGRLLPAPDHHVRVFNLSSGYVRTNRNWVVGRILRDYEASVARTSNADSGIRISIFKANKKAQPTGRICKMNDRYKIIGILVMFLQLALAIPPIIPENDWRIMLITFVGTLLSIFHGALPQWTIEKLPNRRNSRAIYALTSGNGYRDVLIIIGNDACLDFEEFAVSKSPRNAGQWYSMNSGMLRRAMIYVLDRIGIFGGYAATVHCLPIGFYITLCSMATHIILWLALLLTMISITKNTWYLLAIGAIGMIQNIAVAVSERPTESRQLPLDEITTIQTRKVMDGLMDLEIALGCGKALVGEFFPGQLREDEAQWWDGQRGEYDAKRQNEAEKRGSPGAEPILKIINRKETGNSHSRPNNVEGDSEPSQSSPQILREVSVAAVASSISCTDPTLMNLSKVESMPTRAGKQVRDLKEVEEAREEASSEITQESDSLSPSERSSQESYTPRYPSIRDLSPRWS